jgi:hypothetical protein
VGALRWTNGRKSSDSLSSSLPTGPEGSCSRSTNSTMISLEPIGELQVRGHVVFDNVRCSTEALPLHGWLEQLQLLLPQVWK